MALTINSNISSLKTQGSLAQSTKSVGQVLERLSSGLRINRASDDAAGLSIADSLNSNSRIYNRAAQNINDGISLISVADAAISSLSDITTRMVELAEQAATGSYSAKQRQAIDKEAQSLSKEFSRITQTTTFNGLNLFNGSQQGLTLQAGYGTNGTIGSSLGGLTGTGTFSTAVNIAGGNSPSAVTLADINGDGLVDMISGSSGSAIYVSLATGQGTFQTAVTFGSGTFPINLTTGDVNNDGKIDIIAINGSSESVSVYIGNGQGSFSSAASFAVGTSPQGLTVGDVNNDGFLDIVASNKNSNNVTVALGSAQGQFSTANYTIGAGAYTVALGDLNGDGNLDLVAGNTFGSTASVLLGTGSGTFGAQVSYAMGGFPNGLALGDLNGDGALDMVVGGGGGGNVTVRLGNGSGGFGALSSIATGASSHHALKLGDFNGDSILDVAAGTSDDTVVLLFGNGRGSFTLGTSFAVGSAPEGVAIGDINQDGVLDIVTSNESSSNVSILRGLTRDGIASIVPFSLSTQSDALQALATLTRKRESLAAQRGTLGAFQSRLAVAHDTLRSQSDEYKTAESRIRDADFAKESTDLARLQIVQNAAVAVLAQANSQPEIVMSLLGNNSQQS